MSRAVADDLADLARQIDRLAPDRRDPEAFHMAKADIAARWRDFPPYKGRPALIYSKVFQSGRKSNGWPVTPDLIIRENSGNREIQS